VFHDSVKEQSLDDITLLLTIADQIGLFVERARLIKQAEQSAINEERQRLARELHDSVTQLLYGQVLFANAGLRVLEDGDHSPAKEFLNRIDQAAQQALREMRLLVHELQHNENLEYGLVESLERRLESVEKRTGMEAQFSVEGDINLNPDTEFGLYRIAEEALNNTLKHSGAHSVSVSLKFQGNKIILVIEDDGCGFNPEEKFSSGGLGMTNMCDRAQSIGARLDFASDPGWGTRVTVTLEDAHE
jgi:signal transduction histidine kinase